MAWRTLTTRTAYQNPWITVREDEVLRPDGSEGVYGVVEVRDAVFVVALDDDDRVLLVTVDRYTTGPGSVEVPSGGGEGQDPLHAARRELREETGLEAAAWKRLGRLEVLNGVTTAHMVVFLARGLRPVGGAAAAGALAASQAEEGLTDVRWVPFAEALRMCADGRLRDGETLAALALAGIELGRFA